MNTLLVFKRNHRVNTRTGQFLRDGHAIHVKAVSLDHGRVVEIYAWSPTLPGMHRTESSVGHLELIGDTRTYRAVPLDGNDWEDHASLAFFSQSLANYHVNYGVYV